MSFKSSNMLLTLTINSIKYSIEYLYEIDEIFQYIDFINLITNNYFQDIQFKNQNQFYSNIKQYENNIKFYQVRIDKN